jgi:hypothetical protein
VGLVAPSLVQAWAIGPRLSLVVDVRAEGAAVILRAHARSALAGSSGEDGPLAEGDSFFLGLCRHAHEALLMTNTEIPNSSSRISMN